MNNFCEGCAYAKTEKKTGCAVFVEKPGKCWNHTTQEAAKGREKQIRKYLKEHSGK